MLSEKAMNAASISAKPKFVFDALTFYCSKSSLVLPAYSTMQDIVGCALNRLRKDLETKLMKYLTKGMKEHLNSLLAKFDTLYLLTSIKKDAKDFNFKEIEKEIMKKNSLSGLFQGSKKILDKIGISNESVKHYASMVDYYDHNRLKDLKEWSRYLYLICFSFDRYLLINDNLIKAFIYHCKKISENAEQLTKESILSMKLEAHENLKGVSQVLDIFGDKKISDNEIFSKIKEIAFNCLPESKFNFMSNFIKNAAFDREKTIWEHKESLCSQYKKNLRPLVLNIDLSSSKSKDPLISAIKTLKKGILSKKPLKKSIKYYNRSIVSAKQQKFLFDEKKGTVNPDRWEIYLYDLISKSIKSDEIFCKNSRSFRSFEGDLIDCQYWERDRAKILQKTGLQHLSEPVEDILKGLEDSLEQAILTTNQNISSGKNKTIKIKKKKGEVGWSLPYQKIGPTDENSLFNNFKQVSVSNVLRTIAIDCNIFDSFTHILGNDGRSEQTPEVILAVILAMATNTSLGKMADMSDVSFYDLSHTMKNNFRLDTLAKANDKIVNEIATMPIFRIYDVEDGKLFSSSDGQKFETQFPTINSRYSPKYFGKNKGVSSIPGIANHVPFNAVLTPANDHESNYVFDILYNNSSDINPDVHTTDTHGSNKANFILLHLFGFKFAPRLKNLKSRTNTLIAFKDMKKYDGLLIRPSKKVNKKLVAKQWDGCLRIFASLALKTTTQSTIIRKLCAVDAKNKTKQAIWELNEIVKSTYIYEFINDLKLRQNVQKTLNRGESFNKLTRAISTIGSSRIKFRTEMEQKISLECNRLVANIIIYYNLKLLTHMKREKISLDQSTFERIMKGTSPVAWRHINLQGRYEFKGNKIINFDEIVGA